MISKFNTCQVRGADEKALEAGIIKHLANIGESEKATDKSESKFISISVAGQVDIALVTIINRKV